MFSIYVYFPILLIFLISTYTDFRKRLIYNWLTVPGMVYFLIYHLVVNLHHITTYLLGFIVLGGISLLIALISNGIGGGDIKLLALLGLALGLEVGVTLYVFSYIFASFIVILVLIARKLQPGKFINKELPMAPFFALGTLATYLII